MNMEERTSRKKNLQKKLLLFWAMNGHESCKTIENFLSLFSWACHQKRDNFAICERVIENQHPVNFLFCNAVAPIAKLMIPVIAFNSFSFKHIPKAHLNFQEKYLCIFRHESIQPFNWWYNVFMIYIFQVILYSIKFLI